MRQSYNLRSGKDKKRNLLCKEIQNKLNYGTANHPLQGGVCRGHHNGVFGSRDYDSSSYWLENTMYVPNL